MSSSGHLHELSPKRERATLLALGAVQFTHILDFMIPTLEGAARNRLGPAVQVHQLDVVENHRAGFLPEPEVQGAIRSAMGRDKFERDFPAPRLQGNRCGALRAPKHPGANGLAIHDKTRCALGNIDTSSERGFGGRQRRRVENETEKDCNNGAHGG